MKNSIESIELCFKLGEGTLKQVVEELDENPFDRRVLKSRDETLELLAPLIEEAEFVHRNERIANMGKVIYDTYANSPRYGVRLQG